ncbi:RNA polymerase sigma factor [Nocardioides exalbidus]|uniref:RNA polymerase sigma factor n=1 Tax=Nocardioides exalbidus TaxID=402596 RepID=UPI001586FEA1|nr:sigma-70 family RNA polymerase sigma factor [Nocardioides exalbidus]
MTIDGGPPGPPVGDASDNALARRAGLGDRAAFEELFDRLFPGTLRFASHMLADDPVLAEDVVQDAWVKAWQALPEFRGTSKVQTWLFTIVQRTALDRRRLRRPLAVDNEILEPLARGDARTTLTDRGEGDPERAVLRRELWETLQLALSELPWTQRACWVLRELEDMSYGEIAHVLDTTPTVVRGQLHRARRTLAIRMEQWR